MENSFRKSSPDRFESLSRSVLVLNWNLKANGVMKFIPATASGFVPASHEDPLKPGVLKRVIATRDDVQSGQVQMVNWARLPKSSSFQLHYHEDMQEIFVLLSGRVSMRCGNQTVEMNAGDTVIVDVREPHQMTNLGESDAEYLVFGVSSGQGGRTVVIG